MNGALGIVEHNDMNYRQRKIVRAGFWFGALMLFIPVYLFAMYEGFRHLDCNKAKRHLRILAACEADQRCTLSDREIAAYSSFVKLEAARCEKD